MSLSYTKPRGLQPNDMSLQLIRGEFVDDQTQGFWLLTRTPEAAYLR